MTENKLTISEIIILVVTIVLTVGVVNLLFFTRGFNGDVIVKVDNIGNTVILEYADANKTYRIEGIDNKTFELVDDVFVFYSDEYRVSKFGTVYGIIDSDGKRIGNVKLERCDTFDAYRETLSIDLSKKEESLYVISNNFDEVKIFSSNKGEEYSASFRIEDRTEPLEVVFEDVSIIAPDFSPVIYSVCDADVNITVKGNVKLKGGNNPYTSKDASDFERFAKTFNVAGNAFYLCMVSALGGATSIIYGVDYYSNMFMGISSLQYTALDNAWGQVENLVYGEDGAPGLDGVCAVQIAGDLNIVGNESARLTLIGGNAGHGDDATNSYMTSPPNGGDGGNGGSALVCNRFVNNLSDRLILKSGDVGIGGFGGTNIKGEKGHRGKEGDQLAPKVVLSEYDISFKN